MAPPRLMILNDRIYWSSSTGRSGSHPRFTKVLMLIDVLLVEVRAMSMVVRAAR